MPPVVGGILATFAKMRISSVPPPGLLQCPAERCTRLWAWDGRHWQDRAIGGSRERGPRVRRPALRDRARRPEVQARDRRSRGPTRQTAERFDPRIELRAPHAGCVVHLRAGGTRRFGRRGATLPRLPGTPGPPKPMPGVGVWSARSSSVLAGADGRVTRVVPVQGTARSSRRTEACPTGGGMTSVT